jgi:hypothetical protein
MRDDKNMSMRAVITKSLPGSASGIGGAGWNPSGEPGIEEGQGGLAFERTARSKGATIS